MNITVDRVKISVTIPQDFVDKVKEVISKLREVHPYEEPAIDIIPLIDEKDFK